MREGLGRSGVAAGPLWSVAVASPERETVSGGEVGGSKALWPSRCSVNRASCFQSLNNVPTSAASIMLKGKLCAATFLFFVCVSLIWSFLSSFNVFEKEKLPSMLLLHAPYIRWAARTIQWPYSVFSLLTFVHGALVFYEESS